MRLRGRFNVITTGGRGKGLAGLLLLLLPAAARADTAQLDRFEPSERGSRFFAADSLELDDRLRVVPGLATSYARHVRIFGDPEGTQRHLVATELALHPGASIVLAPGARFGVDVPLFFQDGSPTNLSGRYYLAPRSPVLGDTRVSFDVRLAGPAKRHDGVTLAGGVSAYLPTGSQDDYTSDGSARFAVHFGASARAKWLLAAARVGYMYRQESELGAVRIGPEIDGTAGLAWADAAWTVGPEVSAATLLRDAPFTRRTTPVELLFGVHRAFGDATLGLGGGPSLVRGLGAPDYRLMASFEWAFGGDRPGDRDHDGILDDDDACPDFAGPAETRGCPEPPRDRDGDGVLDSQDACPETPGRRGPDAITNGCADSDRDGIPDPVDACPSIPGHPSADARRHGCPRDADGDGIPDVLDACPKEAGVVTNVRTTHGCPRPAPPADRDKDGVPDAEDACPDHPGKRRDDRSATGCPIARWAGDRVVLADPLVLSADGPGFEGPDAYPILEGIAQWFATHEEVQLVRIEAHCDQAAPNERRQRTRWTEEQARLVRDELVRRGVAKQRLEARGMGDLAPIAPNDTLENRRRNRRIELHVVR